MTKLKEVKQLTNILNNHINELEGQLQHQIKKIKQEYVTNLLDEKIKLLVDICQGENLDFDQMKNKYLKSRDLHKYTIDSSNPGIPIDEDLLDKIIINQKEYYYENKEDGIVYDSSSKQVGIMKNGEIIFH
jgi:hypothetical protein